MKIRNYISDSITSINPQMKEIDIANAIGDDFNNNTFTIEYSLSIGSEFQTHVNQSISCVINCYFKSNKAVKKIYDDGMILCDQIASKITSKSNFYSFRENESYDILNVTLGQITPQLVDGNSKLVQITINVTAIVAKATC